MAAISAASSAPRYWTPHAEHSWLPCTLVQTGAEKATLKADDSFNGEVVELPATALSGLVEVDADQEAGVDDVCTLQSVNEASLLHTVRVRYLRDVIYTRVARVLIALNPFRGLPIYSCQYTDKYMAATESTDLPPHIYGLAKDAVQGIRERGRDQAVLISGESGAGKTESAKLVLNFVTEAVRAGNSAFVGQVCETSPVLEAFGNAMTVRNNNSSRFGKWLDLRFSETLDLFGCSLTSYLLETTRVCSQSSGERSFHVFFQMLQARATAAFAHLDLREPAHYRYLQGAQLVAPGVDDKACFDELCDGLIAVGFDETTRAEIFQAVAGVLTLGNLEFKDGDQAKCEDEETHKRIADLLCVDANRLVKCITFKKIKVGIEEVASPLNPDQARAARDALSRLTYGQLFLWLISRINSTLTTRPADKPADKPAAATERLLGVLDIAGFESFEYNSLEQLMINLSNEHLQQNFNSVVFKNELKDCEAEGITPPDNLGFMDNSDCLELIDGKGGVLDLLDETMAMPKSTNKAYVEKVIKQQASHQRFIKSKIALLGFGIQHFAGGVTYGCDGWLEKNANRSPIDAVQLLASSTNSVLADMGKGMVAQATEASKPSRGAAKKVKSVTAEFRTSLRSLMTKITKADPHYIRCIKPNMEKVPGRIVGHMAMEQLLLSGVLATVRIRQQGYAVRMPHRNFVAEYGCAVQVSGEVKAVKLSKDTPDAELKVHAESMIKALSTSVPAFKSAGEQACAVGKSKVFMNLQASKALDDARKVALHSKVTRIQAVFRGRFARRTAAAWRPIRAAIREVFKRGGLEAAVASQPQPTAARARSSSRVSCWGSDGVIAMIGTVAAGEEVFSELTTQVDKASAAGFQNEDVLSALRVQRRLRLELDCAAQLQKLQEGIDMVEMEKVVARASSLQLPRKEYLGAVESRLERLRAQHPLVHSMKTALAACPEGALPSDVAEQLTDILEAVKEAGLEKGSADWIKELEGAKLFDEVCKRVADSEKAKQAEKPKAAEAEEAAVAPPPGPTSEEAKPAVVAASPAPRRMTRQQSMRRASKGSLIITVDSEADERVLIKKLQRAVAEYDVEALEVLLKRADEFCMRDQERGDTDLNVEADLETARRVFEDLQSVNFVVASIDETCSEVMKHDPPLETLRRLEHLSRQLRSLPGYEEVATNAGNSLRRSLLRRSKYSPSRDAEELQLATIAFGSLATYPLLKEVWTGQRKPHPGSAADATGGILAHAKACIDEALTTAPPGTDADAFEAAAVQNFRNLLVGMGDRPAQECQRQASREAVLQLARADEALRSEVYLQVMKQLVACPRERISRLGWTMLHKLCVQAPPSSETAEFVRQLTQSCNEGTDAEVAATAKSCLQVLDGAVEEEEKPTDDADASAVWTPGVSRLKAENMRLRAQNRQQAQEIERQAKEIERLTAEIVRLGGRPAGARTTPLMPLGSLSSTASAEPELGQLRQEAMQKGMLYRQVNEKSAEELMKWLKQQALKETSGSTVMASVSKGGPSHGVRFMNVSDSEDSDVEIDLSEFAEAASPHAGS